ncbi:MAG: DUF2508 family protein [Lachnospiraceae bacterium]
MKFHFREHKNPQFEEGPKTLREHVLEDLEKTKYELDTAYRGFDYVTDPDLIDCYIYDINAILKRYKYLLEQMEALSAIPMPEYPVSDTETAVTAFIG